MSGPSLVPMISPDGKVGDVPTTRVHDAVKANFKIAQDMISPDGRHGVIPFDRVHDAIRAGFQVSGAPSRVPQPDMSDAAQADVKLTPPTTPEEKEFSERFQREYSTENLARAFPLMAGGGLKNVAEEAPGMLSAAKKIGQKILDWAGVKDETEAEALHDAIAHGDPIGKPMEGHAAGAPSSEALPEDPNFTPDGKPKTPGSPAEPAQPRPVQQPTPAKAGQPARAYNSPDAIEDRGIREAMQEDLTAHGKAAWRQFAEEHAPVQKGSLIDQARNAQFGEKALDVNATSIGSPMRPLAYPNGLEAFKQGGSWFARGAEFGSDSWKQVSEVDLRLALRSQEQSASPESASDLTQVLKKSVQQLAKKARQAKAQGPTE